MIIGADITLSGFVWTWPLPLSFRTKATKMLRVLNKLTSSQMDAIDEPRDTPACWLVERQTPGQLTPLCCEH